MATEPASPLAPPKGRRSKFIWPLLLAVNFSIVDKKGGPKSANDVKLINAGKILENNKTVGQCRTPFGDPRDGLITMHAVVQMSLTKTKIEKKIDEAPKTNICACTIL